MAKRCDEKEKEAMGAAMILEREGACGACENVVSPAQWAPREPLRKEACVHEKVGGVRGCAGGGLHSAGRGWLVSVFMCVVWLWGGEKAETESWERH